MKEEWVIEELGEVATIINGGTPKSNISEYWDGDIFWLTPKDMGQIEGKYTKNTSRKISKLGLSKSSAKLIPANSVILSTRAPIGYLLINLVPMATNQGCRGLVPSQVLNTKYLYYYLFMNVNLLNDLGSGTTFKELSKISLSNVKIPLPPLSEQKRIVAILEKALEGIDKAIANTEKNLANASELFESYIDKIFSTQYSEYEKKNMGDLALLNRGHNPPKSQFSKEPKKGYIRFYQIRDGKSDDHAVYVPDSPKLHHVEPSDILMVAYRHIGGVFRGASGAFNVALCKIQNRNREVVLDDYLYNIIPTKYVKGKLLERSERSLIPSMSIKHLEKIKIPVPPIAKQHEILNKIELITTKTQEIERIYMLKLSNIIELKQSILQKAFSGELTKDFETKIEEEAVA